MTKYINELKIFISAVLGYLLGGWDFMLQLLVMFIVIDYISGMIVAIVFKKSPKTENGAAETKVGFKGLVRKVCILLLVMMVTRLEATLGNTAFCRNTIIIFFVANEGLSILENFGLMGIKYPKFIKNALEVLLKKADGDGNESTV